MILHFFFKLAFTKVPIENCSCLLLWIWKSVYLEEHFFFVLHVYIYDGRAGTIILVFYPAIYFATAFLMVRLAPFTCPWVFELYCRDFFCSTPHLSHDTVTSPSNSLPLSCWSIFQVSSQGSNTRDETKTLRVYFTCASI